MKKVNLNDFEKMCIKLEKGKTCEQNKYTYAKSEVENFIEKDVDKLMLIKSEAQGGSFSEYVSILVSFVALALSVINIIFMVTPADSFYLSGKIYQNVGADGYEKIEALIGQGGNIDNIVIGVLVAIILLLVCVLCLKFIYAYKWRKYVLTAVEELEKQFK